MLQRQYLILLHAFLSITLIGCASVKPKLMTCVINSPQFGCDCYDERTGISSFVGLSECDKYVAFSGNDLKELLNYCQLERE